MKDLTLMQTVMLRQVDIYMQLKSKYNFYMFLNEYLITVYQIEITTFIKFQFLILIDIRY